MTNYVISSGTSGYTLSAGDTLTVLSGGFDSGSIVNKGALEIVSSGGSAFYDTINNGGLERVLAGGVIQQDTIAQGGVISLAAGATAVTMTISSGGTLEGAGTLSGIPTVDFGTVSGVTLSGAAGLFVSSGGVASGVTVSAQDYIDANSRGIYVVGGKVVATTVGLGGSIELDSGGTATGTVIQAGGYLNGFGGTLYGVTSNAGLISGGQVKGTLDVLAGGLDVADTVLSKGVEVVQSGGVTNSITVSAGGLLSGAGVLSGIPNTVFGTVSGLTINLANTGLFISSGGVGSGIVTSNQDYIDANSRGIYVVGGSVVSTTIGLNGSLELDSGGTATATVVQAGGYINAGGGFLEGATTNAGLISNAQLSGTLLVQSGGLDVGDNVLSGSVESVSVGGEVTNFTVEVGGLLSGGGSLSGTTGNIVYGTISGLNINSANEGVFIYTGGVGSGLTASAQDYVDQNARGINVEGGKVVSTTLGSAGSLDLESGGTATATVVQAGGYLYGGGGVLYGLNSNAGLVSAAQVSGTLDILSGGADISDTVLSKGVESVAAGAVTSDVTVSAGAVLSGAGVLSGIPNTVFGTVSGLTINLANTGLIISSGGVGSGLTTSNQDYQDQNSRGIYVGAGGKVVATTVGVAGSLDLTGGGVASNTIVQSGGYVNGTGGSLVGVTHNAGVISVGQVNGTVIVQAGGFDGGDTVLSGGVENVQAGGETANVTVEAGGLLSGVGALSGIPNTDFGMVVGLTLTGVAQLIVSSGGVASGVTASAQDYVDQNSRGIYVVGGSVVATTLGPSGSLELDSGGTATGTVVQANGYINGFGGFLEGVTSNAGVISGGQVSGTVKVLAGGFDSTDTVLAGGVESVAAGGETILATVEKGGVLSGAGALSGIANTDFGLVSGLTLTGATQLIVSSGGVASRVTASAQVYIDQNGCGIYVVSGGSAVQTVLGESGSLEVESGGVASATTVQAGGLLFVDAGGSISGAAVSAGGLLSGAATASGVVTIFASGTDSGTTFVSGSTDLFYTGATQGNVTVSSGATFEFGDLVVSSGTTVVDGPVASDTLISGADVLAGARIATLAATVLASGTLAVSSGGVASATTVSSGGVEDVLAGGTAIDATVLAGGVLSGTGTLRGTIADYGDVSGLDGSDLTVAVGATVDIFSGGSAFSLDLMSGATLSIGAGGVLQPKSGGPTTVALGGLITGAGLVQGVVNDRGTVDGVSVGRIPGGTLNVDAGGTASGVDLLASGKMVVFSGATATATTVNGQATLSAALGAVVNGATVSAGGLLSGVGALNGVVEDAGTVSGVSVGSGAQLDVTSGGAADGVTLLAASELTLSAGGIVSKATISAGALLTGAGTLEGAVIDFGTVEGVTVGAGSASDVLTVQAGGIANNVSIADSGTVAVRSNGTAQDIVVSATGTLAPAAGGVVSNATILSGGVLDGAGTVEGHLVASSGASVERVTLADYAASEDLYAGARNVDVTIGAGDVLDLFNPVIAAGSTLSIGEIITATTLSGADLEEGAEVYTDGAQVRSGGTLIVGYGGVAVSTTVANAGKLTVAGGAQADGLIVLAGGSASGGGYGVGAITDRGSIGILTLEDTGTVLTVFAGGSTNRIRARTGTELEVLSGGVASATTVLSGATISAVAGGTIKGVLTIESHATAKGVVIASGASEALYAGGIDTSVTIAAGGVLQLQRALIRAKEVLSVGPVTASEIVSGATLLSGSRLTTVDAVVANGGVETVLSGGAASGTTVERGGVVDLSNLAIFSGGVVDAGGAVDGPGALRGVVTDSGAVSGASIAAGATLMVASGGSAAADTVLSTGVISTVAGATLANVKVIAGGTLIDNGTLTYTSPATLAGSLSGSGTIVESAGGVTLSGDQSGFDGHLTIKGGIVTLASSSGIGAANVNFVAGSSAETLRLGAADTPAQSTVFAAALFNFDTSSERLDLASVAFTSGTTATVTGHTLVLVDGTYRARFTLDGTQASSYVAVSDGAGGTLIRATVTPPAAALLQAAASFSPHAATASLAREGGGAGSEAVFLARPSNGMASHAPG